MINLLKNNIYFLQFYRNMSHRMFVYGTLKHNEPNHHWLTNKDNGVSTFIAEGVTRTKYPLIIGTIYNIPFLLYSPGKGYNVKGEIYEVDDKMLCNLDILENHPSYYFRQLDDINVTKPGCKETLEYKCWVYFLLSFKPDLLTKPMMETYSSNGDHGLPYLERSKRDPNYDLKTGIK